MPFFFAGLVTAVAFAAGTARPGAVYAAAMSGSAVGVLLPIVLLPAAGLRAALMVPAVLVLIPLLAWPDRSAGRRAAGSRVRRPWLGPVVTLLAVGLGVGVALGQPALEPRPGPYKYLAHVLRFPDTRLVARRDTAPRAHRRSDGADDSLRSGPESRRRQPRAAAARPGTRRRRGPVPGGGGGGRRRRGRVAGCPPSRDGTASRRAPRSVLVLQEGGGVLLLAAALRAGRHVRVAEPSAAVARRLRRLPVPAGATLQVVEDEPRALARRLARDGVRFEAVLIEDWGASLAGTESHTQEPLLTVEAFRDYLALLEPGGVLSSRGACCCRRPTRRA